MLCTYRVTSTPHLALIWRCNAKRKRKKGSNYIMDRFHICIYGGINEWNKPLGLNNVVVTIGKHRHNDCIIQLHLTGDWNLHKGTNLYHTQTLGKSLFLISFNYFYGFFSVFIFQLNITALPFKSFGLGGFSYVLWIQIFYAQQRWIYLIKNAVKTVLLRNIITIYMFYFNIF